MKFKIGYPDFLENSTRVDEYYKQVNQGYKLFRSTSIALLYQVGESRVEAYFKIRIYLANIIPWTISQKLHKLL